MDNKKHYYRQREKLKKFKVYYFTGDYWSGKGEIRKQVTIMARSESEAEQIFKDQYPDKNFGWIDYLD